MTNVIKTHFILHGGDTAVLHSMSVLQVHQKVSAGANSCYFGLVVGDVG